MNLLSLQAMPPLRFGGGILILVVTWLTSTVVRAECRIDRSTASAAETFTLHLSRDCTEAERDASAVPAQDIMRALMQGKGVDLAGVVVRGDLFLDDIPVVNLDSLKGLPEEDRQVVEAKKGEELHLVQGPFVVTRSRVEGRIVNRLKGGYLAIAGPVVLAETQFLGPLDLSRSIFLGLVDMSRSKFEAESFFVQSRFTQGAMFTDVRFGPHARFHRARFNGPADFRGASFSGLSEFLEVVFRQKADFSRVTFHMGTGFSGTECLDTCDFSEAQFQREAFFLFTRFEGPGRFASAHFHAAADFTDSEFKIEDDLAQASYAQPPMLTRAKRLTTTVPGRVAAPFSQVVTIGLLLAASALLLYVIRSR
jgi:hypothetical protein